jgi:predicted nucleic acid-binding protein
MPKSAATVHGVLCDTSFFIRWAKPDEVLHPSAQAHLKFLVEGGHELYVSTIALAEYAVRDSIAHLPLLYFRVLPFNVDHAQRAGEFARAVFEARKNLPVQLDQRAVIANDTKLFAQADVVPAITHYLTADRECEKVFNLLKSVVMPNFQFAHLSTPWHETFGWLDLPPP